MKHRQGGTILQRIMYPMQVGEGGCWLFSGGGAVKGGYRQINAWGRRMLAHRAVWVAMNGAVPDGLEVRHSCDVANCVNPNHLLIGTRQENERDKDPRRMERDRRRTVPA